MGMRDELEEALASYEGSADEPLETFGDACVNCGHPARTHIGGVGGCRVMRGPFAVAALRRVPKLCKCTFYRPPERKVN